MNLIKKHFEKDSILFLSVAFEPNSKVDKILTNHPFDFQTITNGDNIHRKFKIRMFPTSFFVNKNGEIVEVLIGYVQTIDENGNKKPDAFGFFQRTINKKLVAFHQ